jgi:predicted nuclease of predicted toxin-antitoxin system
LKLLLDQNLSPRLIQRLSDLYPGSAHVSQHGLEEADDTEVWAYARENGYLILSKDADFSDMSSVRGFPPKIIWIRRGNCSTGQIEEILRKNVEAVRALNENDKIGLLMLH